MKTFPIDSCINKTVHIPRILYHNESHPHKGLSEARWARRVFLEIFYLLIRLGGAPSGAAAFIATEQVDITPYRLIAELKKIHSNE